MQYERVYFSYENTISDAQVSVCRQLDLPVFIGVFHEKNEIACKFLWKASFNQ